MKAETNLNQYEKKYRDQWGGKTPEGEEMWWSSVWPELEGDSWRGRFRFALDPRHFFLIGFLKRAIRKKRNPQIADFGCGTGGSTVNFSRYLDVGIHGWDIFPTQIAIAKEQSHKAGSDCQFSLLNPDGTFPLRDQSLDVVFSSDVLGHVPDIRQVVREWSRVLKPGGRVVLFTESRCSPEDHSLMARLERSGIEMIASIPEHVSLLPREELERIFESSGFQVEERISSNVWHFFFAPKDYVKALAGKKKYRGWYWLAKFWTFFSNLVPFYPKPFYFLRNAVTLIFGKRAYGCNYFYLLKNRESTTQ